MSNELKFYLYGLATCPVLFIIGMIGYVAWVKWEEKTLKGYYLEKCNESKKRRCT